MEPQLVVEERLQPILGELRYLEPLFHAAYWGATPEKFEEIVADGFWEIGALGRRYSREYALSVLKGRETEPLKDAWETKDFHVFEIGTGNYLLSYTLLQSGRVTRRATLWQSVDGSWKAIYHQGTVVVESP